ncbi:hypothetical protein GCM10009131_01320 [Morganella psychrotolerans]
MLSEIINSSGKQIIPGNKPSPETDHSREQTVSAQNMLTDNLRNARAGIIQGHKICMCFYIITGISHRHT